MPRLTALIAVALALVAAGCGGDDDGDSDTVVQTTTVTESTPTTETTAPETTTETDPELTTPEDGGGCTDASGNTIEIVGGDVDCAAAKDTAAQYDAQGDRVQELGEWICEGGNAQTRPVIFTCSGPGGEFTVSEAGSGSP